MVAAYNEPPYRYFHASTAQTNTNVKAATGNNCSGILHSVIVNNPGATTPTITLVDNTSGGSSPVTIAVITPSAPATLIYDIGFGQGLVVSSTGGTAPDFTIAYS